ncbi:bifunctional 2',3'-cyclic-nucleotide 2'-phosphodiesterase/3'-nucleotidase [Bacillus weihaiensis]|nr:bifunctional 2',3'-cyclic-nucleotide 2'-phosphodiesterase/3'-nucleotidase [Bacillus weihaiensis]
MKRKIRRNMKRRLLNSTLALSLSLSIVTPSLFHATPAAAESVSAAPVTLRIMETTDIHANIVNYDYYSLKEDHSVGFAKTATLIKQARKEVDNSLLFDNGDLLQGTPLGDYVAKVKEWAANDTHPIYDAMNLLDYDLGNYGNHEFNYGLDFLEKSVASAEFDYVNANIYKYDGDNDPSNDVNYFDPYKILEKVVKDENGTEHTIKVGVIGFVPPQITQWDKAHLTNKVVTHDIKKTAEKFVPKMKAEGADIIVAIPHSGIGPVEYKELEENQTYQLSEVDGIDAILFGHTHTTFPGSNYNNIENVDNEKGTINGVAAVQPGYWGNHLGIIDLTLEKDSNNQWKVVDSQSTNRAIFDSVKKQPLVDADQEVLDAVKDDHDHTIEYVNGAVGKTSSDIYSYFSQVKDDPSIQIVSDAQKAYIEKTIQGTEYEGLPVLSAAAPFKSGRDGATDFTEIPAGDIAIKDTTSLYKYPNTVMALKLTGAEVKEWLEWSAGQFNQIDPNSTEEQLLVKPHTEFPGYNFDIIDGVTYEIDVTKPARYNDKGDKKINDSERIVNLEFNGKPIDLDQQFIIATNNYRATFTPIANPGGDHIIIESPDENRQVLVNYIRDNESINPTADQNWSFAPINGDANIVFTSSPNAQKYVASTGNIQFVENVDNGFAKYSIDLSGSEDSLQDFDVTLIHTNDTHAHLENVARRITAINDIRSDVDNSFLLDAGDVFSGTLYFNKYSGLADIQFMNMVGYDAMVPGNHEFDKGPETLATFIKEATFPIVSSNIDYSKEATIRDLYVDSIGDPGEGGKIYPATIIERDGEQIGVFGLTTEETAVLANPGPTIHFKNYIESAENAVELLEEAGINKVVALTHLGYTFDKILAESVDGIDVIVGGHSHTLLEKADVFNKDTEPTLVVQAQEYGNYIGRLDLTFNQEGVIEAWNDQLININEQDSSGTYVIEENSEAAALLETFSQPIEDLKQQKVGNSAVLLDGERDHVRSRETNLGNLITDGMLSVAKSAYEETSIAIQNGGGIRASIDEGEISLGEVLTTMPFGNTLVTIDLTGEEIIQALENGVSQVELGGGRFPQVSGLHFTFNRSLPPGERIVDVLVETESGLEPIDLDHTYKVATNAFMADGGDGYSVMKAAKDKGFMQELFIVDYEVFTTHLDKVGTVTAGVEGRITEVINPVTPTVNVDGDKASVTVTLDDVKKAPYHGTFPINLDGTEDAKTVEISLDADQIAYLIEQHASIEFIRNDVAVTIPASNLEVYATTFTIENLGSDEDTLTNMYDFTIEQNGTSITTFEEAVTLSFTVDPTNTVDPAVYYLNEETNEWELQESSYNSEAGKVNGYVNHFSVFTVMEMTSTPDPTNPDDDDKETGNDDSGTGSDTDSGSDEGTGSDSDNTESGTDTTEKGNIDYEQVSSDDSSKDQSSTNGKSLPNTATNSFNFLLLGLIALAAGGIFFFIQRKRKLQ